MDGVLSLGYDLNPPHDELTRAGVQQSVLDRKRLLAGIADPKAHFAATDDWRWICNVSDLYASDQLTGTMIQEAMYQACLPLATFPLANHCLHVLDQFLHHGGTKKAVNDAYRTAKDERWETIVGKYRGQPEEAVMTDKRRVHALNALSCATHLKNPLTQLASCFWHCCEALSIPENESGLTDLLRAHLPNPFLTS